VPERRATVGSARKMERPAINCTALFAYFLSWSNGAWNVACARSDLCKVEIIFLEYLLFGRPGASVGMGEAEIISRRASGIILLWQEAWRSGMAVVVIGTSGDIRAVEQSVAVQGNGRNKLDLCILFQRLASWSATAWNLGIFFGGGCRVQGRQCAKPYISGERPR